MRIAARTVCLIVISSIVWISTADAYDFLSWIKARLSSEEVPFLESTSDTFSVSIGSFTLPLVNAAKDFGLKISWI
jgi:hypothetical protein